MKISKKNVWFIAAMIFLMISIILFASQLELEMSGAPFYKMGYVSKMGIMSEIGICTLIASFGSGLVALNELGNKRNG